MIVYAENIIKSTKKVTRTNNSLISEFNKMQYMLSRIKQSIVFVQTKNI